MVFSSVNNSPTRRDSRPSSTSPTSYSNASLRVGVQSICPPGSSFAVRGLDPTDGDADGLVGEIRFPVEPGGLELREDLVDESLGMPQDLNGDGFVDDQDHADDYRLLPVSVTLRWKGTLRVQTFELRTLLADR